MPEIFGSDAFLPKELAERANNVGVAKAQLPFLSILMLCVLVGVFIGLGRFFLVICTLLSWVILWAGVYWLGWFTILSTEEILLRLGPVPCPQMCSNTC